MSMLAIALAASGAALPQCSWDRPGVNPFMGDVVAAVDRYKDIPAAVRTKLKARMQTRSYDEIVSITREAISGKGEYGSQITGMHFGNGSVCATVTRAKWTDQMQERGLVYCEDGHCILVPTVCRNVSRITRTKPMAAAPAVASNTASSAREGDDPQDLLDMDPTGAGASASEGSFAEIASAPTQTSNPTSTISNVTTPSGGLVVPALPVGTVETPAVTPAVPEPGTWALMLAGLAAVGWAARRRSVA
jgi:PEP-CTERM motif